MKKILCIALLAFLVTSCERVDEGLTNKPLELKKNEFKKANDSAQEPINSSVPEESVDPKDIVPPRR